MSPLPHIIWDMGGIMYRYFTELLVDHGRANGWPLGLLELGPTGDTHDPDYERLLSGEIDEPEYLPIIRAKLSSVGIEFDPLRDLDWSDELRPETWRAIERIHQAGHRQALLTNDASKWLGDGWWETWEPAKWFDAVIDVKTLGSRKPSAEPYLATADALDASASDCLFVDDLPVNCAGAEAVGMTSHLYDITDTGGSVDGLLRRLGIAAP